MEGNSPAMLASHRALLPIPAALLVIQLPGNARRNAVGSGSSIWSLYHVEDAEDARGS